MKILNMGKNEATISLSIDELGFLNNAINETFEAIGGWEFSIRTGWTEAEAKQLQTSISAAYQALKST